MYEVSVEKTKSIELPELIDSVVGGEEIVFTRDDRPVAKLIALPLSKPQPQFGSAKGLFTMSNDFDAPLDDFEDYRR